MPTPQERAEARAEAAERRAAERAEDRARSIARRDVINARNDRRQDADFEFRERQRDRQEGLQGPRDLRRKIGDVGGIVSNSTGVVDGVGVLFGALGGFDGVVRGESSRRNNFGNREELRENISRGRLNDYRDYRDSRDRDGNDDYGPGDRNGRPQADRGGNGRQLAFNDRSRNDGRSGQDDRGLGFSRGGNDGGRGQGGSAEPNGSIADTQDFVLAMEKAAQAGPGAERTAALSKARAILDDPQNGFKDRDGSIHFPTTQVTLSNGKRVHFEMLGRQDYRDYRDADAAMAQVANTLSHYERGNITAADMAAARAAGATTGNNPDAGAPTLPPPSATPPAAGPRAGRVDLSGAPDAGEETDAPGAGAGAGAAPGASTTAKPAAAAGAKQGNAKLYSGVTEAEAPAINQDRVTEIQNLLGKENLPKYGADGKWGKETQAAFEKAAKAAGITDPSKIDFTDPQNPLTKQFDTYVRTRQGKQAAAVAPGGASGVTPAAIAETDLPLAPRDPKDLSAAFDRLPTITADGAQVAAATTGPDIVVTASPTAVASAKLDAAVAAYKALDAKTNGGNGDGIIQKAEIPVLLPVGEDGKPLQGNAYMANSARSEAFAKAVNLSGGEQVSKADVAKSADAAEKAGVKFEDKAAVTLAANTLFAGMSFPQSASAQADVPAAVKPAVAQAIPPAAKTSEQRLDQTSVTAPLATPQGNPALIRDKGPKGPPL